MSKSTELVLEHPKNPIHYPDAIHYVEQWLDKNYLTEEDREQQIRWKIYDYYNGSTERALKDRPWVGVRVAEVSVSGPRGGGSYMQVDAPWGLAFCAQVERCILALVEGWNRHAESVIEDGEVCTYGNDTDDEFWRLAQLIEDMTK